MKLKFNSSWLKKVLTLTGIVCLVASAPAATHIWAGSGISGFWSLPANWSGNNPPVSGEAGPVVISFPAGASRLTNTNNIGGLVVDQLTVGAANYSFHGSGSGTSITFNGSTGLPYTIAGGSVLFASELTVSLSGTVPLVVSNSCVIQSTLQGSGGFSLAGGGALLLNNAFDNSFSGAVSVLQGALYLKSGAFIFGSWSPSIAVPGNISVGQGNTNIAPVIQLLSDGQIAGTSTLNVIRSGVFYINGCSNSFGAVTMNGGQINGGSPTNLSVGTLGLSGSITVTTSSVANVSIIGANLSLLGGTRTLSIAEGATLDVTGVISDGSTSAGGISKSGNGLLGLFAANSYAGSTLINAGSLWVYHPAALGATGSGTTVANGAQLVLPGGLSVAGEPLVLNGVGTASGSGALLGLGTNTWSGPVTLATDSTITASNYTDEIILSGLITGSGGFTKDGAGTLELFGNVANTYGGSTLVKAGKLLLDCGVFTGVLPNLTFVPATAIPGYLEIGTGTNNATVQFAADSQLSSSSPVKVDLNGLLHLFNYSGACGPLTMDGGTIKTGNGTLTLGGNVVTTTNSGTIYHFLSLGGANRLFDVATNAHLYISSPISNGSLTKTGPGQLYLLNSNTYAGPTMVNGGTLELSYPDTFVGANGGIQVNNGAILNLNSTFALEVSNITLTLNGGALTSDAIPGEWYGPIQLAGNGTFFNGYGYLNIYGAISGPGSLTIATLPYTTDPIVSFYGSSDNTYAGPTIITNAANLVLVKSGGATAIPGTMIIGNGIEAAQSAVLSVSAPNQIANNASVIVNQSGTLQIYGNDTIGSLTMSNGLVNGSAQIALNGNVTNYGFSSINCPLSLGGITRTFYIPGILDVIGNISDGGASAGFNVIGQGSVQLENSNSFSGALLVDDASTVWIYNNHALGAAGPTVLTNRANLYLSNVNVTNKAVTVGSFCTLGFTQTNVWNGPIQLAGLAFFSGNTALTDWLELPASIGGTGTMEFYGTGNLRLTGTSTNTFSGGVYVDIGSGVFELAKTNAAAFNGLLEIQRGTVRLTNPGQLTTNNSVMFFYDQSFFGGAGLLDFNGYSSALGDFMDGFGYGTVNLGSATLMVSGVNATNFFLGTITGVGGYLDKTGTNTLVLGGTNSYSGGTFIHGGKLFINGSQPSNNVSASGGTIGGTGSIGNLGVNVGSTISPGYISPGTLSCRNLSLGSGGVGVTLAFRLNGTNAGVNYDQLNASGTVNLGTGNVLAISKNFNGAVSNQFVIINNTSTNNITGSFNVPLNRLVAGGAQLQVNYADGIGTNDVTLTQLTGTGASLFTGLGKQNDGTVVLSGTGVPSLTYSVQASTNLTTTNWVTIGTNSVGQNGLIQFVDAKATNFPVRFYRFTWP